MRQKAIREANENTMLNMDIKLGVTLFLARNEASVLAQPVSREAMGRRLSSSKLDVWWLMFSVRLFILAQMILGGKNLRAFLHNDEPLQHIALQHGDAGREPAYDTTQG